MSNKTKKQLLLNLPYFIAGLVCTNLGEAWRIAEGADMSEKLLGFLVARKPLARRVVPKSLSGE